MIDKPLTREDIKESTVASTTEEEQTPLDRQTLATDELIKLLVRRYGIGNDTLQENKTVRFWLMCLLTALSLIWLLYTSIIINSLAFNYPFGSVFGRFSDAIAIAFMTTSLATVLGLWHFGLRYFFTPDI